MMQNLINNFQQEPRRLLLVDALGALLSAALLYFLLMPHADLIGLPQKHINGLAIGALCLMAYDLIARIVYTAERRWTIAGIALLNTLYCVTTLGLLALHYPTITLLGWGYFLGESAIIVVLVYLEWRVSAKPEY